MMDSTESQNISKEQIAVLMLKMQFGYCTICKVDKTVFCPRDCDVQCLECGEGFCLGHIIQHQEKEHFITSSMEHCTKKDSQ